MKSITTQLKNLALAYIRRMTPCELSVWQDWLRALADALPALKRDEDKRTLDELRDCARFAKQQERLRLDLQTMDGRIPGLRWTTGDPSQSSRPTVSYTERHDKSIISVSTFSETVPSDSSE